MNRRSATPLFVLATIMASLVSGPVTAEAQYRVFADAVDVYGKSYFLNTSAVTSDGTVWEVPLWIERELGDCPDNCGSGCSGRLDNAFVNAFPGSPGYESYKVCGGYRHWEIEAVSEPVVVGSYTYETCSDDKRRHPLKQVHRVEYLEMVATWKFHGLYTVGCQAHDTLGREPWLKGWMESVAQAELPSHSNLVWLDLACTEYTGTDERLVTPHSGVASSLMDGWRNTKRALEDVAIRYNMPSHRRVWGPTSPRHMRGWRDVVIGTKSCEDQ